MLKRENPQGVQSVTESVVATKYTLSIAIAPIMAYYTQDPSRQRPLSRLTKRFKLGSKMYVNLRVQKWNIDNYL